MTLYTLLEELLTCDDKQLVRIMEPREKKYIRPETTHKKSYAVADSEANAWNAPDEEYRLVLIGTSESIFAHMDDCGILLNRGVHGIAACGDMLVVKLAQEIVYCGDVE